MGYGIRYNGNSCQNGHAKVVTNRTTWNGLYTPINNATGGVLALFFILHERGPAAGRHYWVTVLRISLPAAELQYCYAKK